MCFLEKKCLIVDGDMDHFFSLSNELLEIPRNRLPEILTPTVQIKVIIHLPTGNQAIYFILGSKQTEYFSYLPKSYSAL